MVQAHGLYLMANGALPAGPDREALLKHIAQTSAEVLAYIANDKEPSSKEIIFLLEKLRRTFTVTRIFLDKANERRIERGIADVLVYLDGLVAALSV
jgi:hypothetical protein